jgi:hypothetical protein
MESQPTRTWSPSCCGRPCYSSSTPWPFPSPCWSSPRYLIIKTSMAPSVSSETQLTRVERTWRFSCHARDRVIGPFIICIEVMFSSIGSSHYLCASRADIFLSICMCASSQSDLKECHLRSMKRILRYFATFDLVWYFDTDYVMCKLDRKSTSGTC